MGRADLGSNLPAAVPNLGSFVHPTLLVSLGRDSKRRWSLLPVVGAMGMEISHITVDDISQPHK